MNIFHRRPLSLILCIALGSFAIFTFSESVAIRIALISIYILTFIASFFKVIKRHISTILTRVICVISLITILFSHIYFDVWFDASKRYHDNSEIYGTVEDINYSSYSSQVFIKTESINNTAVSKYNLILYLDYASDNLSIVDYIEAYGEIESFSSSADFDAKS